MSATTTLGTEKLTPRQKWQKQLFAALAEIGMRANGYTQDSCELYLCGFATVQCSISRDTLFIERYYDNEMLDIDRHFNREFPIEALPDTAPFVALCRRLIASVRNDEPILNFGEI